MLPISEDIETMENRNPVFAEERKREILTYINNHNKASVSELCEQFGVSGATVRSDLRELDRSGLIFRTHGGAILKSKVGVEPVAEERDARNLAMKRKIARMAAELIEDNDTIILDAGSTTLELAKLLSDKKNLVVITNDFYIAQVVDDFPHVSTVVIGGKIRKGYLCTVGTASEGMLKDLTADKAFLGANSYSVEKGASTVDFQQAEIKRLMVDIASRVILLVDGTKIGKNSLISFARPEKVDCLVTDSIDQEVKQALEDDGIEVLHADDPPQGEKEVPSPL
jgi:DeoR family fructose operon transcriptional repressor